jgi:transposase
LAQLLRADLLPEAWIAPLEVRQLRALLRHRASLVRLGTQLRNRIHARTGKCTLLAVHSKRGTEAVEAMGVLPRFAGVAIHDAWAPYDTYAAPDHQFCCAHVLRELQAVTDATPQGQWCWAT